MLNENILEIKDLTVKFGNNKILDNLSFFVKRGEILAIIGPNGAGKSVLFRTLLGTIPYSGIIRWPGPISIGYVPQRFSLEQDLPLTVWEFLNLKSSNVNKNELRETLNLVGFGDNYQSILKKRVSLLSGGQLQRILIAWALLDSPDLLLFDEPTSGIDIGGENTIYNLLDQLRKQKNITIILISHDLNVVSQYADSVVCLNKKQVCFGTPSIILDPQELAELYGGEPKFYQHHHEHSHRQ